MDADADTTTSLGTVRGQLIASNLPKSVSVTGQFGSQNHVDVIDPGGIADLRVQATATLGATPGSALVDFTDIPGEMHGLPALVGLLFPGVTGDYGTFAMNMFDVDVNRDVYVKIRVNDPLGIDHTPFEYTLPSHIDSFVFHKYDMNGPADIFTVSFVDLVCFNVTQNPEPTGKSSNGVTLNGSDGPQTFNFIDRNDELPDVLVNVLSAYMSPFGHSFGYNVDGC